jgi:hypothetical protein
MAELDKPGSDEPPLEDIELEPPIDVPTEPYYFDDLKDFGWSTIGVSIAYAGGVYPIVVGMGVVVVMLLLEGGPYGPNPLGLIGGLIFFAGAAGVAGILWAAFVSVVTLPVLHLILWSLKLRVGLIKLGAFAGGLVGFLSVLPATLQIARGMASGGPLEIVWGLLVGPGAATLVGQLGGARGGGRAQWRVDAKMASRRGLARIGRLRPRRIGEISDDPTNDNFDDGIDVPRFRFRTVHLLWLGVWFSLLLTVIRLSGISFELVIPMLLVWLVYQAVTLALGGWLLPRVAAAWSAGRQRNRST